MKKIINSLFFMFLGLFVFNIDVYAAGKGVLVWRNDLQSFKFEVDNGVGAFNKCYDYVNLECDSGLVNTVNRLTYTKSNVCEVRGGISWAEGSVDFKENLKKYPAGSKILCKLIPYSDNKARDPLATLQLNKVGESDEGKSVVEVDEELYNRVTNTNLDCDSWGILKNDFKNVFDFIKVLIPLLIIGLSTYDFIKAISNKDDKDIKKAFNKLMKRMIFAVIFFFLPILLEFLLELIIDNVCVEEVIM